MPTEPTPQHAPREHAFPVRVYWEDTDAGGIVYHASYLRFLERGRSEWLRARGVDQAGLRERERLQFAVVDMHIEWRRAARYDDALVVLTALGEARGARFDFEQRIVRGAELIVAATVRAAALDADSLKPRRLPPHVTQCFA
ncbi:MAG: tol-pal system-associated acyl-CoA thioesterase [Proteobacteria bacterium]|nr:tol-pal system-associated acyl-CoA thioesterase [Pseudomonadota bacterium]